MKYTCPTCGKTYDVNYCDECKKIIELPTDNSGKNAMLICGIIISALGILGILGGIMPMISGDLSGTIWFAAGIALGSFGLILMGISAVVDRLNTIIKLMKEKTN